MNKIIFIVDEAPDGSYLARALGEAIFTEADNLENLRVHVRDAVQCHFDQHQAPRIIRLHLVSSQIPSQTLLPDTP